MKKLPKISWNAEYVKTLSEAEFIKEFKPAYPDHDLAAEYNSVTGGGKKASPAPAEAAR